MWGYATLVLGDGIDANGRIDPGRNGGATYWLLALGVVVAGIVRHSPNHAYGPLVAQARRAGISAALPAPHRTAQCHSPITSGHHKSHTNNLSIIRGAVHVFHHDDPHPRRRRRGRRQQAVVLS